VDPRDEAIQYFLSMLEIVFGREFARQILEAGMADYETFLAAPETYKARIEDMVQSHADSAGLEEIAFRMFMRFPELMTEAARTSKSLQETDRQLLAQLPCSGAFVDVVLSAGKKDAQATRVEIRAVQNLDYMDLLFGATGMARYVKAAGEQANAISFEENTRMVAASLAHAAEAFYKPMLASTLRITRIDQESPTAVPGELGAVINQARDYWQSRYPRLLGLLDDNTRIIRNSEAHKHTKIDVRKETVSFTNLPRTGVPETIVFDKDELARYVFGFMNLCLGFHAGYREVERRLSV
jgi:hypothetical protein